MSTPHLVGLILIAVILLVFTRSSKRPVHGDLELRARLLMLSHDRDEIRQFLFAKMNYLTEESFQGLLNRIEQLDSDKAYVDSLVKDKIDTL